MYTLITGASSGVGRVTAIELSKTGPLIINGRNRDRLEETMSLCSNQFPVIIWEYNFENIDELEKSIEALFREHNILVDKLVYCAGAMGMTPLRSVTIEKMQAVYAVNVFAPELLLKALSSKRINKKELKVAVVISSNISARGAAAFSVYGSSKAALDGVVRNLAVELAPAVRVNSILPGGMITEMTKDIYSDEKMLREFEKNYPLGMGKPEDILGVISFLLSEEASWITGQQFVVDGGRTTDITERISG